MSPQAIEIKAETLRNALTQGETAVDELIRGPKEKPYLEAEKKERTKKALYLLQNELKGLKSEEKMIIINVTRRFTEELKMEVERQVAVTEELKAGSTVQNLGTHGREITKELKEGDWKTWVKYGSVAVAGGIAAKWIWGKITGAWDWLVGNKEDHKPGILRKIGGWFVGLGGAALGAIGLSAFMKGTSPLLQIPRDVAAGGVEGGKKVVRKFEGLGNATADTVADVQKHIEKGDWGKAIWSSITGGGVIAFEGGKAYISLGAETFLAPYDLVMGIIDPKNIPAGQNVWSLVGDTSVRYVCGSAALQTFMSGKMSSLKVTSMRILGGPATMAWDVAQMAVRSGTPEGRALLNVLMHEHWAVRVFEQPLSRPLGLLRGAMNLEAIEEGLDAYKELQKAYEIKKFMMGHKNASVGWSQQRVQTLLQRMQLALQKWDIPADAPEHLQKLKQVAKMPKLEEFESAMNEIIAEQTSHAPKTAPKVSSAAPPKNAAPSPTDAVDEGAAAGAKLAQGLPNTAEFQTLFQGLKNTKNGEKVAAGLTKILQSSPHLQKLLSENPKMIQGFNGSRRAQALLIGAVRSGDAKEVSRILTAAQQASKARMALSSLGVGADVLGIAMAYYDWQATGEKMELAKQTNNEELQALYRQAYVRTGISAGVSTTSLVVSGVAMYSAYQAGATVAGAVAAGSAATLVLLPVGLAVMGGAYVSQHLEGVAETWMRNDRDWARYSPAQLLEEMAKIAPGKGGFLESTALDVSNWNQGSGFDQVEQANDMARLKILRMYVVKTSVLPKHPDETDTEHKQRFDQYVSDQMDFLAYNGGTGAISPSSFEFARTHARLSAGARQAKLLGQTYETKVNLGNGKSKEMDLAKYDETHFRMGKNAATDGTSALKFQMLTAFYREERGQFITQIKALSETQGVSVEQKTRFISEQLLLQNRDYISHLESKMLNADYEGTGSSDIEGKYLAMYTASREIRTTLDQQSKSLLLKGQSLTSVDINAAATAIRKSTMAADVLDFQRRGRSLGWDKEAAGKQESYLSIEWMAGHLDSAEKPTSFAA